jgi:hypothetical protein
MVDAAKLPKLPQTGKYNRSKVLMPLVPLLLRFALSEQDRIGDRIIAP